MQLPVNIENLINGDVVESDRIEFKRGWNPDSIYRTICAFANDFQDIGGGYIVVGVEEQNGMAIRPVWGIEQNQLDKIQRDIEAFNNLLIPYYMPRVFIEQVDEKYVVVIWVPAGDRRPYKVPHNITSKNKSYRRFIRYNSTTIEARDDYERELFDLANRVPFDDRGNPIAGIEDVSLVLLRDFLVYIKSKLVEHIERGSALSILQNMDLVEGTMENLHIKNVALMLFCYQPERFFPCTQVDIVIYPKGKDKDPNHFIEVTPIKGPVHLMIKATLEYLKTMLIQQKITKVSAKEEADKVYNYPYQALEEAVVNALYHRSYQEREPVEISIMPEMVEIVSYRGADRSINLDDLSAGRRTYARRYRNRRLGDFLKELNLTEGRGTGIPTIRKVLEENGSPTAIFKSDEDRTYFYVAIPCHRKFVCDELMMNEEGVIRPLTLVNSVIHVREKLLSLIIVNQRITRRELSQRLSIAPSAVQKHLTVLQERGYISRQGKTKASSFIVFKHRYMADDE